MKILPKSSLFKKYVLSYILVFSLPLVVLLIAINFIYINSVREELSLSNENYLEQSNLILNDYMIEVKSLGNYINQTNTFNRFSSHTTGNVDDYKELIKHHEHSANSIEALYIVLNESSHVFSSRGNMTTEAMLDHAIHFSNIEDQQQMYTMLEEPEETVFLLNNRLFYKLPLGNRTQEIGSVLVVLNTHAIRANLDMLYERNEGMSLLANSDGDIMLSSSLYPKIDQSSLEVAVPQVLASSETKIDGTNYLTNKVSNDLTGWSFVSLIDSNQFYRPLYKVLYIVLAGMLILTALGLIISYYFANRNYKPVHNLINTFDKVKNMPDDEWHFIERHINQTKTEVENLNSLMDEHAPIVKNATLLDLLEGHFSSHQNCKQRLLDSNISFDFDYYSTIVIELGKRSVQLDQIVIVEKINRELRERLSNGQFTFESTIPPLRNNQLVLIVNLNKHNRLIWNSIIESIKQYLEAAGFGKETIIKIGVGSTYDSFEKIKNSYVEASTALEIINKKRVKGSKVLYFKDINQSDSLTSSTRLIDYPKEGTLLLLQSIKQGNAKIAEETVQELFNQLKEKYTQPISLQAVVSYIYNSVMEVGNELDITEHNHLLFQLTNFHDVEQAQELLIEISGLICTTVKEKKEYESNEIGKNIVQFIFDQFKSPDVSLEQIASKYNISISYASKLIKEETGESFSNIIQSLRMNKFKELLVNTPTPIKELVVEVGYYDVSNFTRKFRKENELTPGQYRKKYKKQEISISSL